MKAEKLLHLTLEENGYEEFVTKGSGFSQTIVEAMERYAKDYHESKVKKLNKPAVIRQVCTIGGECKVRGENNECKGTAYCGYKKHTFL
jgi:hypothetical protein